MVLEDRVIALEAEVIRLRTLLENITISQVEGSVNVHLNTDGAMTLNLSVDNVNGDYGVVINSTYSTVQMLPDNIDGDMSCSLHAQCEQVTVTMTADNVDGDIYTLMNAPIGNLTTNSQITKQE